MQIFDTVKDFLFGNADLEETLNASLLFDQRGEPISESIALATSVTLLAAASSDTRFSTDELRLVAKILEQELGKGKKETLELIKMGIEEGTDQSRAEALVRKLLRRFDDAQRQRVFSLTWKVILADDRVTLGEEEFAEWLARTLDLSEKEITLAKKASSAVSFS